MDRPGIRKAFLLAASVASLLIAAMSGLLLSTIRHVENSLTKIPVGPACPDPDCLKDVTPTCGRKACTFLVLGNDTRPGLAGERADTIMLVQVDGAKDRTVVLSIPRDLRVQIPGHGLNKINTALGHGPNVMVKTVESVTGLSINHYVEVSFVGFQQMVDVLGGVPICVSGPMFDSMSGLRLPRAGCYDLDGREALAFVRARHVEGDLIPDFSRISRQQLFIRALIHEVLSADSALHLPAFIRAAQENLRMDENLNLYSLQDLLLELSRLGQEGVVFRVVPAMPFELNGVSYLRALEPEASLLFERLRQGKSLGRIGQEALLTPLSPANIRVRVLDARSGGRAEIVFDYLEKAGFIVLPLEAAPKGLTTSVILWRSEQESAKDVVAAYLSSMPTEVDQKHTRESQVTVVIGSDFAGLDH
jgi:LCP family protein required for cell wall assembly